jgi:hypothetical protein
MDGALPAAPACEPAAAAGGPAVEQREPVVEQYLLLGLRLGRLIDGYLDSWYGDPALARQVADEPAPVPAELARQAAVLATAVPDSGLADDRRRFLTAQVRALRCTAAKLAGEPVGFRSEVEQYFDVSIAPSELAGYQELHDELAALLPGTGSLRGRLVDYRERARLGGDLLGRAVRTVSGALRWRLAAELGLPDRERVDYTVVHDRPWNAFNSYLGGFRSRVSVNSDAGHWLSGLAIVVAHEAYPGHHAERCLKERELVRARGWQEHTIALVNTPQSLVSEGAAELALAVLGDGWGAWLEAVLRPLGLRLDGPEAERVDRIMWRLTELRQDAAIMLHDRHADPDEVAAFLSRWLLVDDRAARQMLRFLLDPLWRAYIATYVEGRRLVGHWLQARPAGQPVAVRYRRLLGEQWLPAMLRVEPPGHPARFLGLDAGRPTPVTSGPTSSQRAEQGPRRSAPRRIG